MQACFEPGTVQLSKAVRDGDIGPAESPPQELITRLNQKTSVAQPIQNSTNVSVHLTSYVSDTFDQSTHASTDVSFTSTGVVSNNSFDRNYAPLASNSACSTSSPPSEAELLSSNDTENDRLQNNRSYLPLTTIPSTQVVNTHIHQNGMTSGQNNNVRTIWNHVDPLSNKSDLNLKSMLGPADPRLLILAASGLPSETNCRWTPTDVREVLLE